MRILFMGTPEFAAVALRALATQHQIIGVITRPPARAGRGKKIIAAAVQQAAEQLDIQVSHNLEVAAKIIATHKPDFCVVAAYGKILPPEFLQLMPNRFINIHASLLPRWRGAAPIARAIIAGDKKTGISIMQMEAGLDSGAILTQAEINIGSHETAGELEARLGELGAKEIIAALRDYETITPTPQNKLINQEPIIYAAKINKQATRIDWNKTAEELDYFIRGHNPIPMAWFSHPTNNSRIRILLAEPGSATTDKAAGTILDDKLNIACGNNSVLQIIKLQREGKAALTAPEFLLGNKLPAGIILG